jgi:isoleucyl-tRNA synthetase
VFEPVPSSVSFPKLEEEIGRFWQQRQIYEKSLQARAGAPAFVFYEGPPTANGVPHPGHCLTRAIKDLFPRYKTMRGYRCERKGGWDTHGLPVEIEVCKELGIHSKEEIEQYGIEPFVQKCVESVFRYTREWEQLTERLGFWIRLDQAYVTFHQSYVESVWWALKQLFDRGLLYQGHKIVWWWAQGGTALSSGEVGEGYRQVADPSVYVRFPLVDTRGEGPGARGQGPGVRGQGSGVRDQGSGAGGEGEPHRSPLPPGEGQGEGLGDVDLLVWTTTPWTLPSNQFAAVHPELEYSVVAVEGNSRKLLIASALVEEVASKSKHKLLIKSTLSGQQLVGRRYMPPFDYYYKMQGETRGRLKHGGSQHIAWRVVAADFVTVDTGTGVVHQAPAFGEVDYDLLLAEQARFAEGEGPPLICAVASDGTFTAEAPDYQGRWVKDCDRDIIHELRQRGLLYHEEQYVHEYPFCPRAEEDPLIQYPRRSWFIRTTEFNNQMLANNARINWLPEHIRDGRFGNFLETNVDWALSRERYWGTPLPIWVCERTGYMEAVASYEELLAKPGVSGTEAWGKAKRKNPRLADDLCVHKPYIDAVTYDSPKAKGARMRRVPEVIDCWFDAGAMPFAQWGYPHAPGSAARFQAQFPADFISEALDQTRGWFYSLLAISTLLFGRKPMTMAEILESPKKDEIIGTLVHPEARVSNVEAVTTPHPGTVHYPHPFRNCIVLGLLLGEDGEKMSKRKRNYREPGEIFDRYGADAMRWYFFANQPPWTTIRFSEQAIRQCIPEFLLTFWNVYSFFVIYASIDGFDPAGSIPGDAGQLGPEVLCRAEGYRPTRQRGELDRWVLSELSRTAAAVVERMDAYDNFAACTRLTTLVDALSNWYVRRSRDRFWTGEQSADKTDAYWTLYECLLTTCKLIAPFVPFLAEAVWQNLVRAAFGHRAVESVHLCDYPTGRETVVDDLLSEQMALVREIVSLGRSARMSAKLKVRQPLSLVEVILADQAHQAWLKQHTGLICDELNVKRVEFTEKADQYITYTVLPNLKRLGPRLGRRLPALKKHLARADGGRLLAELEENDRLTVELPDGPVVLERDDVQIRLQARPGWAAAQGPSCVVVLSTELTEELLQEGLARDVVRAVQDCRRSRNYEYTQRISVAIVTDAESIRAAVDNYAAYIRGETLANDILCRPLDEREREVVRTGRVTEDGVTHPAFAPKYRIGEHDVYVVVEAISG